MARQQRAVVRLELLVARQQRAVLELQLSVRQLQLLVQLLELLVLLLVLLLLLRRRRRRRVAELLVLLLLLLRRRRRRRVAARRQLQHGLQAGGVRGQLRRGRVAQAAHDAVARRELLHEPLVHANNARAAALGRAAARHRGQRQAGEANVDRVGAREARGEHLFRLRGKL